MRPPGRRPRARVAPARPRPAGGPTSRRAAAAGKPRLSRTRRAGAPVRCRSDHQQLRFLDSAWRACGLSARAPCLMITLVLGGARSGKSRYAENLLSALPPPRIYVATAEALDDEMAARIAAHRERRDTQWRTVEVPRELAPA